jgi:cytochrome c-type biogenesis protein CcmE
MKTIHIIIILVVVIIIAVVITTFTGAGSYATFTEASNKPGREFHIIGKLDKTRPIEYDAAKNANQFSFYMIDGKGAERKVVYNNSKPQDFEKSDQVVVIGSMGIDDSLFTAKSLLLKCPSKYNSKKVPEKFGTRTF